MQKNTPLLYSVSAAAKALKIRRGTVSDLCRRFVDTRGRCGLRCIKIGAGYRISAAALADFIQAAETATAKGGEI